MACKPGYYGIKCDLPCPAGTFGKDCAGKCSPTCADEECNMVIGCLKNTENTILTTKGSPTTVATNNSIILDTSKGYVQTSEKIKVDTTDQAMPKSDFNTNYLFAGLGISIVFVIFGILVHLWKKSKSLERKLVIQQTCQNNKTDELSSQTQKISESEQKFKDQPCNTEHFYRRIEADYDEISEELEMHMPTENYELPKKMSMDNETNLRTNEVLLPQNTRNSRLISNGSDFYLHPLFVPDVQRLSDIEERNSYIEVI